MQIHVVQERETLFSISNLYGTSIHAITEANELETPNLVVGQTLVIPIVGQYYFVQQGDSLYSIAQMFHMSVEELVRINNIPMNVPLQVGFRLYIPPRQKSTITTLGYIEPIGETVSPVLENAARKHASSLTFLAPFSYRVNRDGTLSPPLLDDFQTIAAENNSDFSLVITNLEGASFSSELVHIILTVQAVQNRFIDEVINTAKANNFQDVHFDFEYIPEEDREAYNNLLRKIKPRLEQEGILLSSTLAPKTSGTQEGLLYEAHDYGAIGEINDFVVIMTYEWGYSAGPPMPVSPINEVERVLNYAMTEMPGNKILMGQNLYGYDWTLPFVQGESFAKAVSPQQAIRIARENNVAIEYDETAQAPFFNYTDNEGKEHIVWFEDARSIQAKFDLVKRLGLLGIAYWKLGLAFPQNWLLLQENFQIRKN